MANCCDRHLGTRGRCQELRHGIAAYRRGCRCDQCRESARRARARWRSQPILTLVGESVVAALDLSDWRQRARQAAAEAAYPDSGGYVSTINGGEGLGRP